MMKPMEWTTVLIALMTFFSIVSVVDTRQKKAATQEMCEVTWPTPTETKDAPNSIGVMRVLDSTCDRPPQRQLISRGEYLYYVPTSSTIRIAVDLFNDSDCLNGTLRLSDNLEELLTWEIEKMASDSAVFILKFGQPTSRIAVLCLCKHSSSLEELEHKYVEPYFYTVIGYKPEVPENFECIVTDFNYMDCSWDEQRAPYILWTFCYKPWQEESANAADFNHDLICQSNYSSFTVYNLEDMVYPFKFIIFINGSNKFGNVETTFEYEPTRERLSKPLLELSDPVGSRNANLQWYQQCDNTPQYSEKCSTVGLRFKITVSVVESASTSSQMASYKKPQEIEQLVFPNSTNANNFHSIDIADLRPYTTYKLQMVQRLNSSFRDWSEPTDLIFFTDSALPERGPYLNQHGFSVTDEVCPLEQYRIQLYWKALDAGDGANGNVTSYSIQEQLHEAEARQTSKCVSRDGEQVSIYSVNKKGKGTHPSVFSAPSTTSLINIPSGLVRACKSRLYKNSTTVYWKLLSDYLSLSNKATNTTYTIFWCKHQGGLCQEEFDWMEMKKGSYSLYKSLSMKSSHGDYMYGVGVTQGSAMSGIIWAPCLLGYALPRHDDRDVTFYAQQHNSTHVIVKVTLRCVEGGKMIEKIYLSLSNVSSKPTYISASFNQKTVFVQVQPNTNQLFKLNVIYADQTKMDYSFIVEMNGEQGSNNVLVICSLISGGIVLATVIISTGYYIFRKRRIYRNIKVKTIFPVHITAHSMKDEEVDTSPIRCTYERVPSSNSVTAAEWLLQNREKQALEEQDSNSFSRVSNVDESFVEQSKDCFPDVPSETPLVDVTLPHLCRSSETASCMSSPCIYEAKEQEPICDSNYVSLANALQC
ncbi:uncharacterized protein [Watersipora subatra]|uniref:uncharacterized protein n=1 Tax=Watersipora subatra TaxID=2589382 RepID=UPI00355B0E99